VTSRRERGQATVELALCLPLVAVVLAAVVEVARLGVDQVRLWHAAREAVRAAAVDPDPSVAEAAARRADLPGLAMEVTPGAGERVAGRPVTVALSYAPARRILVLGPLFGWLRLRAQATMRIEQP
jgi:Flp pilus assembly protein TadG